MKATNLRFAKHTLISSVLLAFAIGAGSAAAGRPPRVTKPRLPLLRPAEATILDTMGGVQNLAFSRDGRTLVACVRGWAEGGYEAQVRFYEVATLRLKLCFRAAKDKEPFLINRAHAPAFSLDGELATGDSYGEITLWDVDTGRSRASFQGPRAGVYAMASSLDGKTLAVAFGYQDPRLIDAATGRVAAVFHGHAPYGGGIASVEALAFAPDGKTLATACQDNTVRLWDAASGRLLRTLTGPSPSSSFWSVAFSPDGRTVAAGTDESGLGKYDYALRLWDAATGREAAPLRHERQVCAVAFRPDGKALVTLERVGSVRLWDVAGGGELAAFRRPLLNVNCLALSPDGRTVALGGYHHAARLGVITLLETDGENLRLREPAPRR